MKFLDSAKRAYRPISEQAMYRVDLRRSNRRNLLVGSLFVMIRKVAQAFSLWIFGLARFKGHRLKPAPRE
jgi:hypothetical protein